MMSIAVKIWPAYYHWEWAVHLLFTIVYSVSIIIGSKRAASNYFFIIIINRSYSSVSHLLFSLQQCLKTMKNDKFPKLRTSFKSKTQQDLIKNDLKLSRDANSVINLN